MLQRLALRIFRPYIRILEILRDNNDWMRGREIAEASGGKLNTRAIYVLLARLEVLDLIERRLGPDEKEEADLTGARLKGMIRPSPRCRLTEAGQQLLDRVSKDGQPLNGNSGPFR
ncbi:MAG: hypothetical protein ABIJ46_01470 [bacterium]